MDITPMGRKVASTLMPVALVMALIAVAMAVPVGKAAALQASAPASDAHYTAQATTPKTVSVKSVSALYSAVATASSNATSSAPYVITVEKGVYDLPSGKVLKIGSYTTIEFDSGAELVNGTGNVYPIRVKGKTDVTLSGGTLTKGGIWVQEKASKVTVSGMTVKNAPDCGIKFETGSSFTVKGNKVTSSKNYSIYLKAVNGAASVSNNKVSGSKSDGIFIYQCKKVAGNITKNTVTGISGTGIHVAESTIKGNVKSNTVKRAKENGISFYHGSSCNVIEGNRLDTIGGNGSGTYGNSGIIVSAMDSWKNNDPKVHVKTIRNNTVKNVTYGGITVYCGKGGKYNNWSYVSGDISGNTLYNCGMYNAGKNWKNAKVRGSLTGIYVDKWALVEGSIKNNKVDKSGEFGIYAHDYATVHDIVDNVVTNSATDGICLYNHSKCIGTISGNTVTDSKRNAFRMASSTFKGDFTGNTITTTKDKGLCVTDGSTLSGAITDNTLTGTVGDAIYVGAKSKVTTISKNTVTKTKGSAASLADKGRVTKIMNNKFTGVRTKNSRGIIVRKGCAATLMSGNAITNLGWGITVESTSPKMTIKNNTITKCKRNEIAVGSARLKPSAKRTVGKIVINK